MHRLIVVMFIALCLMGTSSLALAGDVVKIKRGHTKDETKAGKDATEAEGSAMESDMGAKRGGKKGPIMQYREKMKAKRHEMMDRMKAHKDAAMDNPPASTPAPAPPTAPATAP
ncbi:MAG: hypothetical protein HOP22_15045 [Nitrospiraceae bacterium]|jgi:tRNA/tmRNA/rRNA uracil-C5-methylase (TrmA/RlmC/RlmD family)|nr:hypothetical protein [Nitrospiraceae bacterium]